jgi:Domain of unknown function (DUF4350)
VTTTSGPSTEVAAAPLVRATWRRARLWLLLAVVVIAGAIAVVALSSSPGTPLDPTSADHNGSRALAVLLGQRDTAVSRVTSPADAVSAPVATTIVITSPDDLSAAQLDQLAGSGHRLVVLDPDPASLAALAPGYQLTGSDEAGSATPECAWPGATAAGTVSFPDPTDGFTGPSASTSCYGGAVSISDQLVLLGSADLLRNDHLTGVGVAALDLNAISADGSVTQVAWLMPGIDDAGSGSPTIWDLFPPFVHRAFVWLLIVGALLVLWRGRRLGPVITEPLPVVVRSAEVVEGHGRLYRRAAARERAAAILRAAAVARLAARFGLARGAPVAQVVIAATPGNGSRAVDAVLTGAAPGDDDDLVRLAGELARLEAQLNAASSVAMRRTGGDAVAGQREASQPEASQQEEGAQSHE